MDSSRFLNGIIVPASAHMVWVVSIQSTDGVRDEYYYCRCRFGKESVLRLAANPLLVAKGYIFIIAPQASPTLKFIIAILKTRKTITP